MSIFRKIKYLTKKVIYKTLGPEWFYQTIHLDEGIKIKADKGLTANSFELELIKRLLKPGDVCIDVGANVGVYAAVMAATVGGEGKVYAFEPSPKTFAVLSENMSSNALTNVILSNNAASDRAGETEFLITYQSGLAGMGNTGRGTVVDKKMVPMLKLDDYLSEQAVNHVDFIKVDVEGFEGQVLRGAERTLRSQDSPVIMVELDDKNFHAHGFDKQEVLRRLADIGYEAWVIDRQDKKLKPVEKNHGQKAINFLFSKENNPKFPELKEFIWR